MGQIVTRVRMEPELESLAGHLNVSDRLFLAQKFSRWTRQLRVSARILQADSRANRPRSAPKPLARRRLALN